MSRNRFELSTAANAERSLEPMTTQLPGLARRIRLHAVRMTHRGRGAMSPVPFPWRTCLPCSMARFSACAPRHRMTPTETASILSKGHACAGLYAVLAESGFFPVTWLDSFYVDGAKLPGHATAGHIPGIEVSTGSLGHGLPIACGVALAGHLDAAAFIASSPCSATASATKARHGRQPVCRRTMGWTTCRHRRLQQDPENWFT